MKVGHNRPQDPHNKIYPKNLKLAREYRGLSQTELCKRVENLSQPNLSKFEKGFWFVIKNETLESAMKELDFPYNFLKKRINTDIDLHFSKNNF